MSIYRKHLRSSCMRAIRSAVISAGLVACVASALANEPPGGPSVVITPNCVACLRFEDLAINRGIDLRPAMVSDLTDSPGSIFNVGRAVTSRSIGRAYGNEPREAVIGERVGYKSLGLGEGLTGADSRYVAAEDAAWGAIVWGNPGQWVLEAKGLRAAAGKRLADAFVQRGFCDGPIVRVPTWQLHGADNRSVFQPQTPWGYPSSDETGLDVIRTALQALPSGDKAASICLGKLTPTLDLFDEAVRKKLDAALGRLEGAYAPEAVKSIVTSVLTQLLSSEEGRTLLREALRAIGAPTPGSPPR
jgi:hypothetical protein